MINQDEYGASWERDRVDMNMSRIWVRDGQGEYCAGYVARRTDGLWYATDYTTRKETTQRTGRPTAYASARDMWGSAAGEALL